MQVINILSTSSISEDGLLFGDCDKNITFTRIAEDRPSPMMDGPVRAFVDWLLPNQSGLEMCRRLRADPRTKYAHITMILERDALDDRRRALAAGADDYMVGPVDRKAVLERVLSLPINKTRHHATQLVFGPLTIDTEAWLARWDGSPINLAPSGLRLLRFMAENPNRLLSRQDVIDAVAGETQAIEERSVDVWIGRLRKALKKSGARNLVRTVRWQGYVFDSPVNVTPER